jgi:nanoRNase/pAp phosphatase (c-di-AMP/oligoRNAs hydrolase)
LDYDLCIDHHKEVPNGGFKGLFLNLKAGSCCATIYELIKQHGVSFEEDNELDSKVATALMVGIITDTEFQTSDDTTDYEHEAYRQLFEFRNANALKQIIRYKQPKEWVQARAGVAKAHDSIREGVLVHGIGFISASNRDLIAAVADEMITWESVETSVAFAIVDGNRVEGSVRSSNAAVAVSQLCKEMGGEYGGGGGKMNKGAYNYTLGSIALDVDTDDSTKEKMWEYINERETKRLIKLLRR